MDAKDRTRERVNGAKDLLLELSHRIHANPETAFEEHKAAGWLTETLEEAGFAVERGVCDLPTAFVARYGRGPLHVAVCAEYDCLPGIGHACGHNVIAASAVGAGLAVAAVAGEIDVTVSVLGTPAEEGGGGKILMLERGAFEGIHAAMMVHPAPIDVVDPPINAAHQFEVYYTGKEAHASSYPERGVNAADALTVAQVAIGLLRQHIKPTDRIHGIITKGGDAPNVVPAHTSATYMVRAKSLQELDEIKGRVYRCFEAGALATGATLEIVERERAYSELRSDPDLARFYKANAEALGRVFPDLGPGLERFAGSTDMGNVSLALPAIHPMIGIYSLPAVNHQPEFAAHCVTEVADRAVLDGALAMAWTIIDAATDEGVRGRLLRRGG